MYVYSNFRCKTKLDIPVRVGVAAVLEQLQHVLLAEVGLGAPGHVDHHKLIGTLLGWMRRGRLTGLVADEKEGELPFVRGDLKSTNPVGDVVCRPEEGAEQCAVVRRWQLCGLASFLDGMKFFEIWKIDKMKY